MKEQKEIADLTIQLLPGIYTEATPRASINRWKAGQNVRFHNKLPQKMGGWINTNFTLGNPNKPLIGNPRFIKTWTTLNGIEMNAFGTGAKLYILSQNVLWDITPTRLTSVLTNPFTTQNGNTLVTVSAPGSGVTNGDYVTFSGATAVGGLTLNGQYQVINSNYANFQITAATPATSSATGGGTVTAVFDITAGLDSPGFYYGWGSGPWGQGAWGTARNSGIVSSVTAITQAASAVVTVNKVSTVNPYQVGMQVTFSGATGMTQINGLSGTVQSIGGASGAWTFVVNINTSAFSAYTGNATVTGIIVSTLAQPVRIWSLDNWGQDLMASYRGGPVYFWDANLGLNQPAVLISQATPIDLVDPTTGPPNSNQHTLVSPQEQQLICLGANHNNVNDPLYIITSDNANYTQFLPTAENNVYDARLSSGSKIVTGIRSRSVIVIFTDLSVYVMQPVGGDDIYQITQVAENNSIIGPNAGVEVDGTVYLMGFRKFFKYTGVYEEIPCDVWTGVFSNFNYALTDKVSCWFNDFFSEIWWFYPSASASECDSYVIYNYRENTWSTGTMARTCGVRSTNYYGYPLAIDTSGNIWEHENGVDAGVGVAMDSWVETYDLQAAENVYRTSGYMWGGDPSGLLGAGTTGVEQIHLSKCIPDMVYLTGTLNMTMYTKNYPGAAYQTKGPYPITSATQFLSIRARGRLMSMRIESNLVGDNWRADSFTFETQADGER